MNPRDHIVDRRTAPPASSSLKPPILPPSAPSPTVASLPAWSWLRSATPAWLLGAVLVAIMIARLSQFSPIGVPPCGLRTFTGIPCPLCGSTRSLIALSNFDFAQAIVFNPLVTAGCIGLAAWSGGALLTRAARWKLPAGIRQRLGRLPWVKIGLAIVVANWIYLILFLPK